MRKLGRLLILFTSLSIGCGGTSDEVDKSCTDASECRLVSECCMGCTAVNIDATLPECTSLCDQEACAGSYGEEHGNGEGLALVCAEGVYGLEVED